MAPVGAGEEILTPSKEKDPVPVKGKEEASHPSEKTQAAAPCEAVDVVYVMDKAPSAGLFKWGGHPAERRNELNRIDSTFSGRHLNLKAYFPAKPLNIPFEGGEFEIFPGMLDFMDSGLRNA